MGGGTEKEQFGLGYGYKSNQKIIKCFITTKQIVCNRTFKILASLYL